MKKTGFWKLIAAIGMGLTFLFALITPTGGGLLTDLFKGSENVNGGTGIISAQAANITYPSGSNGLGQFPEGYTYIFTDKNKSTQYHNRTGDSDLTSIEVDNAKHGTLSNPYVIANAADWETFVKYISLDTSTTPYGAGEYFVLAADIDFSSVTNFHAVPVFSGTFYGLGRSLKNITSSTWKNYNNTAALATATTWGYGLFCRLYNATVTDLVVKDFNYKDFAQGKETHSSRGSAVGGIAGYSSGNDCILNCHTNGTVQSTKRYTVHVPVGGIVGAGFGGSTTAVNTTYCYRCSSDLSVSVMTAADNSRVVIPAGIIGENYYCKNKSYIYDCAANTVVTNAAGSYGVYTGAALAISGSGASLYIDGFVGGVEFTLPTSTTPARGGALTGVYSASVQPAFVLSVKNAYADGFVKYGSTKTSLNAIVGDSSNVTLTASNPALSNVHHTKAYDWAVYSTNSIDQCQKNPTALTRHTSLSAMLTAAKNSVGTTTTSLDSKIWDASKIGEYKPDKSPVRNYLTVIPRDVELEYTGEAQDITGAEWYLDNIHGNPDIMDISYPTGGIVNVNANGYNVTFNLKDGYLWNDGTTGPKTIKVVVKPKKLSLKWDTSNGVAVAKISGGLANRDIANPPEIINTYYQDGVAIEGLPQTVGTYTVKATIDPNGNYKLKDSETDDDPEYTFTLSAIPIATPTVSGELTKQYTGEDIVFTLVNCEPIEAGKIVDITQADMPAGATYQKDGNTRTITVKKAGTYRIPFTLNDPENNCWADGAGVLTLTVTQRPLTLTAERENGKNWQFETNTQEQFTITHDAVDGDNIALTISYEKPDGTTVTVGADKLKTEGKTTTVTLDPLDRGDYKIIVGVAGKAASNDNGNYTLTQRIEQTVTVVGKSITISDSDIIWRYSDGQTISALTDGQEIPYAGKKITASIETKNLAEKGVRVASYTNESGLDVGEIETTVTLTKLNESYEFEDVSFTIRWKIVQAKFDLTNVKWDYSGPIGYTGSWITVKLVNVPSDLTLKYTGNRQQQVTGGYYRADVQFSCSNPNYVVPKNGDTSTYIYNSEDGSDFPWTLQWQIKKGVIETNWDFYAASATDKSGNEFNYPTLIGGKDRVDYKFYEATKLDNGDFEVGAEIALEDIVAIPGSEVNYFAEAILKEGATQNFELSAGNNPIRFTVGQNKTPVRITITQSGGMYDGNAKPVSFEFDVVQTSTKLTKDHFVLTYLDSNGIPLSGAPVNAGNYKVQFAIQGELQQDDYYIHGGNSFDFVIEKCVIDVSNVKWNYTEAFVFTREGGVEKIYTVMLEGMPSTVNITYSNNEFSAVGKYTAIATEGELDEENFEPFTLPDELKSLEWEIKARELKVPKAIVTGLTFDGNERDLVALCELDEDWEEYMTLSIKKGVETVSGTSVKDAGTYVVVCTILGSLHNSAVWANKQTVDQSCSIIISPRILKVTGWQGKPSVPVFDGGAAAGMYEVVYKDASENVVANPADGLHYGQRIRATVAVPAGMTGNVLIVYDEDTKNYSEFIIFDPSEAPKLLKFPELVKAELEYNFDEQTFVIKNWKDYKEWIDVLGDNPLVVDAEFIGTRTVKIALKSDKNVMWDDLSDGIFELEITVVRGRISENMDLSQSLPVLSFEGMDEWIDWKGIVEYEYYDMDGSPVKPNRMKEGETYEVVARIKDEYADKFGFGSELLTETSATFVYGKVEEPEGPGGSDGENPITGTIELPLWQLIVGGVSAVLFLICSAKAMGELGKYKAAKKEAKELASVSYTVTYSFAPLSLLAISFLGASETVWTAVACAALGLFLLSLAAMLILGKKRKAAELIVRREKARIEEEKEYARQEEQLRREEQMRAEQQRRDEEFKMMFAAMQQNYQQPQMQYDDMRSLLAETVSALLPAMSQMQALPPAQSDANAYGAPQPQPQQGYGAQQSEVDDLRAQMAQQQELINQLLQQNQAQAAAQAYDEAAAAADEAFWIDESEKIVSLEELYGKLSDDAKRCYYEIGSYIMNKPQTMQNDGKYAVLFKYRGKTLFKLCIKEDAPVLYYSTDDGGKSEVKINSPETLEAARKIVDLRIAQTDSTM